VAINIKRPIVIKSAPIVYWVTNNPVLLAGELGYDSTNNRFKIGNGINTWSNIEYVVITNQTDVNVINTILNEDTAVAEILDYVEKTEDLINITDLDSYEKTTNANSANGYVKLDSSKKINSSQLNIISLSTNVSNAINNSAASATNHFITYNELIDLLPLIYANSVIPVTGITVVPTSISIYLVPVPVTGITVVPTSISIYIVPVTGITVVPASISIYI
jgi:hypothetical protein